ncbi:DUF5320 domain-containing protein [Archaeoglobus profundus]|uniref:DUF5320 domain-containing protein n=1 Tax=Archaeoglobus profundus (strain DSM 5631 / JCM 9629 / NBRC 100127 / Av18) TaxID=572546 RepID=D2RG45_ARCPA|nr:DUF5320 domain-containing protein [Archaeoglobus profundus]ADB57270.1 hypothetical protein Arcpr_0199 [Archaeoglobus profundus DSM 5631]
MWWRWRRYPGHGPWSDLPPWERPGWKFGRGRGWCWWYMSRYLEDIPEYAPSKEEEIRMLEDYARYLEQELERIKRRIRELKGSE